MDYQYLSFAAVDGVAVITVNRPQVMNALNEPTLLELREAFACVRETTSLGGLVLTGAGEKAFVAGADIADLEQRDAVAGMQNGRLGQQVFAELENLGKPSVAAVNGYALGGGMELALACTVRFAAEQARFGLPEVGLGLIPGYGGTQRLPRLVGHGRALDLILTGRQVGAAEALAMGLVSDVVPAGQLLGRARTWLGTVMARAPLAVRLAAQAVQAAAHLPLADGLALETALAGVLYATRDRQEGMRAFLAKRPPVWEGR